MSSKIMGIGLTIERKTGQSSVSASGARGILQRKCACGNHTVAEGQCAQCGKKEKEHSLQRDVANRKESDIKTSLSRAPAIQQKLTIGASDDPLEKEADRVADQVLAAPANSAISGTPPRIQRFTEQPPGQTGTAPPNVDRVLASSGSPLEPMLRADMEQRFGHDFSRVRIHSGADAGQSAREVNAHAYTVGHNIVFGAGRFAPGEKEGQRLIAHELVHVLQQEGSSPVREEVLHPGPRCSYGASKAEAVATRMLHQGQEETSIPLRSLGQAQRALRRTPTFEPDCVEFDRCKVIEPLQAANQLVDRVLTELPALATGTVVSGRIVDLLNVHFHDPSNVIQRAEVVLNNYRLIKVELNANIHFICHPPREDCTTSDERKVGAFTGDQPDDDVGLCNTYHSVDCAEKARMLIHEICHHIPATRIDRAYVDQAGYMALTADQATENPDTYAQFAKMVFLGTPSCRNCSIEVQLRPGQY